MSAKIMGKVWDLDLDHAEQLVLLAFADHADHNGDNVYPSLGLIAWKTGYSERQVKRIVDRLRKMRILVLVRHGGGRNVTCEYRIDIDAGPQKQEYMGRDHLTPYQRNQYLHALLAQHGPVCQYCHEPGTETCGPDGKLWHIDRIIPGSKGGTYDANNITLSCGTCNRKKGAKMAPFDGKNSAILAPKKGPSEAETVPSRYQKGAKAMAYEPSEPSDDEPSNGIDGAIALWDQIKTELAGQMTHATFNQWLRPTRVLGFMEGHGLLVEVSTRNAKDWLDTQLAPVVKRAARPLGVEVVAFTVKGPTP